jgi:hypothetical protein
MKMQSAIALAMSIAIGSSSTPPAKAAGMCMEPRAPSAFLTKPSKPVCFNGCSEFQISSYRSQVRSYFANLEQYATDVDRYYKRAAEYVECMSDLS